MTVRHRVTYPTAVWQTSGNQYLREVPWHAD